MLSASLTAGAWDSGKECHADVDHRAETLEASLHLAGVRLATRLWHHISGLTWSPQAVAHCADPRATQGGIQQTSRAVSLVAAD